MTQKRTGGEYANVWSFCFAESLLFGYYRWNPDVGPGVAGFPSIFDWKVLLLLGIRGIVTLICGIIAIIGAKSASTLVWAIVLIIVGLIGGGLGGFLVLLGGILGLVTVLSKKV